LEKAISCNVDKISLPRQQLEFNPPFRLTEAVPFNLHLGDKWKCRQVEMKSVAFQRTEVLLILSDPFTYLNTKAKQQYKT